MTKTKISRIHLRFAEKLFIALALLFTVAILLLHSYFDNITQAHLYKSLGERAQIQAKELAIIPELVAAVNQHNLRAIRQLINQIDKQTDASYIVIGDKNAHRLFHTQNAPLNSPMVGGDNADVLKGASIIALSEGSLGISLRGKAPIIDDQGNIIGIVSVGYLLDEINEMHKAQSSPLILFSFILFITLFVFSYIFSYLIKKQMFNLEPKEISLLVRMQKAMMESINEGLIAIDLDYQITHINHFAIRFLKIPEHALPIIGQNLFIYLKQCDLLNNTANIAEDIHDSISHFNDEVVIASRIRLMINGSTQGWVITFRKMNEINSLNKKLSQVQLYADNLRALRHEHQNWLATLLGLIYMQRYDEAKEFITQQSNTNQQGIDFITDKIKVPAIAGLLIGKYAKANELGLELQFDPLCQLSQIPNSLTDTELMSIIANLLDNAFTASLEQLNRSALKEKKVITLYISDMTNEYVIEVSDAGTQIDESMKSSIFKLGVTTKKEGDGVGLYLVKTYTEKAHGFIEVSDNAPQGTIFSIFIPK
ncbi:sensor histidine kinase [Utexia brackfieldae]|uniref:ATP-binding protein n=1 Tax=Utexia brackfieldae TaxID=3074108 RepID=UPI00370D70C2